MSHEEFKKRTENIQREKSAVDQRLDDLRQILASVAGRRYMKGMLTFHGIYTMSSGRNAQEMAEEKGRRNAGIKILDEMKIANPELTLKMLLNL